MQQVNLKVGERCSFEMEEKDWDQMMAVGMEHITFRHQTTDYVLVTKPVKILERPNCLVEVVAFKRIN